jgi:colicin import membrane protein
MNRTVLIGAIVVLLAGLGYYQFVYVPQQQDTPAAAEGEAPATEAPATESEAPATEAPATEAPATEAPATEAPATEAPATEAPATEAPAADAAAALDPANFNADAVVALIDGAAIDDAAKATLKTAVEAARANPALVADTIAQVKTALGM